MKIHLAVGLAGLAITFALPTFAQQTNTPDPQLREALTAFTRKLDDAMNNNDAASRAALYTKDAVMVTETGPIYGRDAIEKWFANLLQKVHISGQLITIDQDSPHSIGTAGNEMWATGGWSFTVQGQNGGPLQLKGYWSTIKALEDNAWKTRMEIWNVTPAPTTPAQTK